MKAIWMLPTAMMMAGAMAGCAGGGDFAAAGSRQAIDGHYAPDIEIERAAEEEELGELLELSDYLRVAALRNRGLRAAFERWQAAEQRIPQARSLPDPMFTYRYMVEQEASRWGHRSSSFELMQTFPWFGKLRLRGEQAGEEAEAEFRRLEAVRLALFNEVGQAYYEFYYLARAAEIVRENVRLMEHLEGVARSQYRAGAASQADVLRAQVELGRLMDELRSLEDLRGPTAGRLNAILDRPVEAALPWPAGVEPVEMEVSDAELLEWLAESNPQLQALASEAAGRRVGIELARKEYWPDVTLGGGYKLTTSGESMDEAMAMMTLNLPIWYGRLRAGVRESRYAHLAAVAERQERQNMLGAELKMAAYRFRDAQRKIELYRHTLLPRAEQSLRVSEAAFRAGEADFLDLVDSQRVMLEFQMSYERALAERGMRLSEMEMLVGRNLPRGRRGEDEAGAGGVVEAGNLSVDWSVNEGEGIAELERLPIEEIE